MPFWTARQQMLHVVHDLEVNLVLPAVLQPVNVDPLQEMLGRFPGVILRLEALPPCQELMAAIWLLPVSQNLLYQPFIRSCWSLRVFSQHVVV